MAVSPPSNCPIHSSAKKARHASFDPTGNIARPSGDRRTVAPGREARRALDPMLWRIATDASTRIEKAVGAALTGSQTSAGELWFVAEQAAQIVGVTHAVLVPVPPIYDGSAGRPGLLLDDCFISADAPSGTAEALLTATEVALVSAGAPRLIASCPVAGPLRPLYERHGYEPVTLYMAKHRFSSDGLPPEVRRPAPRTWPVS
jgi:hypothetical protein